MRRRTFVSSLAAGVAAPMLGATSLSRTPQTVSAQEATPAAGFDDGLAHPAPMTPGLGVGKDRALVLGGGGIYMISFHMGYIAELLKQGIDLSNAEVVVGTSAGSIIGAILMAGQMPQFTQELDAIGEFPWLLAKLLPPTAKTPAQLRASKLSIDTKVATTESVRAIGAAAMAANNPAGPDEYYKSVGELLGFSDWPSPALHTTANDWYTGERIIVSQED
ncbi:MAG: patatin-like phospholipase family protein, partial [Thermomicrobiales bacterium]